MSENQLHAVAPRARNTILRYPTLRPIFNRSGSRS